MAYFDLTSYETWDLSTLDDKDPNLNYFRGNSMCHSHVTKLGKIIGTEERVDLKALVNAMKNAYQGSGVHTACSIA